MRLKGEGKKVEGPNPTFNLSSFRLFTFRLFTFNLFSLSLHRFKRRLQRYQQRYEKISDITLLLL